MSRSQITKNSQPSKKSQQHSGAFNGSVPHQIQTTQAQPTGRAAAPGSHQPQNLQNLSSARAGPSEHQSGNPNAQPTGPSQARSNAQMQPSGSIPQSRTNTASQPMVRRFALSYTPNELIIMRHRTLLPTERRQVKQPFLLLEPSVTYQVVTLPNNQQTKSRPSAGIINKDLQLCHTLLHKQPLVSQIAWDVLTAREEAHLPLRALNTFPGGLRISLLTPGKSSVFNIFPSLKTPTDS
jgi:hypothetical protein